MKEIERYKITSANGNSSNVTKCDDGHWVNFADVEQLQARIKELETTIKLHEQLAVSNKYKLKEQNKRLENYIPLLKRVDSTEMIVSFLIKVIKQERDNGTPPTTHHLIKLIDSIINECNQSSMVDKDNYMFLKLQEKFNQLRTKHD